MLKRQEKIYKIFLQSQVFRVELGEKSAKLGQPYLPVLKKPSMVQQKTSLPHTGIATFCKAPFVPDVSGLDAEVAVVGIPYDEATAMRPGSRQAPRAIRDASTRFGFLGQKSEGFFDMNGKRSVMSGVRLADCGDVDVIYFDQERNFDLVYEKIKALLAKH